MVYLKTRMGCEAFFARFIMGISLFKWIQLLFKSFSGLNSFVRCLKKTQPGKIEVSRIGCGVLFEKKKKKKKKMMIFLIF